MVEFALCLPLLAMLSLGTIDLGRAFQLSQRAKAAAREAAAYASRHPGQQDSTGGGSCADPANAAWHGHQEGGTTYTFTFSPSQSGCVTDPTALPASLQPGQNIKVTATTTLTLMTPFIRSIVGGNPKVSSSVCMTISGGTPTTVAC